MENKSILLYCISFLFTLSSVSVTHASMPDFFSEAGSPNPERGAISTAPTEVIDTFSGNLNITQTDLSIPGDGGLAIQVVRSYSPNNVYVKPKTAPGNGYVELVKPSPYGLGWQLHFGRVRLAESLFNGWDVNSPVSDFGCSPPNQPTDPDLKTSAIDNPVLEMPDGSQRQLICNDYSAPSNNFTNTYGIDAKWVTNDNWAVYPFFGAQGDYGFKVYDPIGNSYTMEKRLRGGRADTIEYVWYTTRVEDRNGNSYSIEYDDLSDAEKPIYDRITSSDNRLITFQYRNSTNFETIELFRISYRNRVVEYAFENLVSNPSGFNHRLLKKVKLPGDSRTGEWNFNYYRKAMGDADNNLLETITFPLGATTSYDYDYACLMFNNCSDQ